MTGVTYDDYISTTGDAVVHGGLGADMIVHTGGGTTWLYGDEGDDKFFGSSVKDKLDGGAGNDVLQGSATSYQGGAGNDTIVVLLTGAQPTTLTVDGGADTDQLLVTFGAGNDAIELAKNGASSLKLTYGTVGSTTTKTQVVNGIEQLDLDAGAGADLVTVHDLAGAGLGSLSVELGRTATVNGTKTVKVTSGGKDYNMEVPDVRYSDDRAADTVVVEGGAGTDTFTLTNTTVRSSDLVMVPVTRVARTGAASYLVDVGQGVRGEGDQLVVDGAGGNDTLTAAGTTQNLVALTLKGGTGNDTLVGSVYDDVLDGGDGNDTMTGGLGRDTFRDSGGVDTLVESIATGSTVHDMGLYDDLFVVGTVVGTDFAPGAVVENLDGIFEKAVLKGDAVTNVFLVGDADGALTVGSAARSVKGWSGDVTLTPLEGNDLVRVELRAATGARVHVTDSAGTDTLQVWGTSLRENIIVDTSGTRGLVRQRATTGLTGTGTEIVDDGSTATDLVSIDHSGMDLVELRTLAGGDRIAVRRMSVEHHVEAGAGDDQVAVGSLAGVNATLSRWPNTGGTLNAVTARLVVDGGSGPGSLTGLDQLHPGRQRRHRRQHRPPTGDQVTGLGLGVGVTYTAFESLAITLGSGSDTYTVDSTHAGTVTAHHDRHRRRQRHRRRPVRQRAHRGPPRARRRHRAGQLHQHRDRRHPGRHPGLPGPRRRRRHATRPSWTTPARSPTGSVGSPAASSPASARAWPAPRRGRACCRPSPC